MEIYSVYDKEFRPYGKVLEGFDTTDLTAVMELIPLPEEGTAYESSIDVFEKLPIFEDLTERVYGGMPIELGMCWGRNTKLNCLEYHRDSEINIGSSDFFLLLAHTWQIQKGRLSTKRVKGFRVPKGVPVEIYSTTLHYAPCHTDWEHDGGFRVAVALPAGTNTEYRLTKAKSREDEMLWARNKWLLAHREAPEAGKGAYVGLIGENIDLETML